MNREFDYVLLGGGTCCGYCAAAIREIDKSGSIAIVSADSEPPYDRPPFSKGFLKNESMTPSDAHSKDESFYPENNIELILNTRVTKIDRESKKMAAQGHDQIAYGKLLYALGAEPISLSVPGAELAMLLRSAADGVAIRERSNSAKKVCIVGAGWIGAEVAATMLAKGLSVTIIEKQQNLWPHVPAKAAAAAIQRELASLGAEIRTGREVAAVESDRVILDDASVIECDFVVAGIGDDPCTQLAKECGLPIGSRGVRADSKLRTADPSIWAAGDVCEFDDNILGSTYQAEHHLHAKATGAHAGKCMAGQYADYIGVPYFFSDVGELSYIQRGYPEFAKESFVLGDPTGPVLTELFLFENGTFAGGSDIRREYKQQDPINDLFEELVKSRTDAGALRERLSNPSFDVLELKSLL